MAKKKQQGGKSGNGGAKFGNGKHTMASSAPLSRRPPRQPGR